MKKEFFKELAVYLLFAAILYFFYKAWWAFIALIPACIIYHRRNKKRIAKKKQEILGNQFKDALISITAALRAGYSIENSIYECRKEMALIYTENSPIYKELSIVVHELSLGTGIEEALGNMAKRNNNSDIDLFAGVFSIAKRSGGDMVGIIKKTADDIASKVETKGEIAVAVSSKKLEQNIMSFMPLGILMYISLSSPDLLAPLYGNALGVLIMTICLGLYILAYFISLRIMNIEV